VVWFVARSNGLKLINDGFNDGFVYYKHAVFYSTRCELMDWSRVDYLWIIVMF